MKPAWTVIENFLYYVVCVIVAMVATFPPNWANFIPAGVKPYVLGAVLIATWLKSHWNLFINPNGTPAETAWTPPAAQPNNPNPPVPPPPVQWAILCAVLMLAAGATSACHAVNTPPPPSSTTLSRASDALSVALAGAEKSVKQLRDAGKIPESETVAVQNCLKAALIADQKTNVILAAAAGHDLTTEQKIQIGQVWASAALTQVAAKVSPQTADILKAIVTAANTVFAAVGVPTL